MPIGLPDLLDLDAPRPDAHATASTPTPKVGRTPTIPPALERVLRESERPENRPSWWFVAGCLAGLTVGLILGAWLI